MWWVQWLPYAVVLALVSAMSLHVGEQVGMFREAWAEDTLGLVSLQLTLIWRYLSQFLVPLGLSAVYGVPESSWDHLSPWLGLLLLVLMTVLGTWSQRSRPLVAVGLGTFLVCLAPVSPWMSLQNLQADRYMLLPSAGVVLAIGAAWPADGAGSRRFLWIVSAVSLGFALVTGARCQDWHSTEALWRSAVRAQPERVDAWASLAGSLVQADATPEAEEVLAEGLEIHPGHPRLLQSRGWLRMQAGEARWPEAEADFRAVLEADPTRMKAGKNLSIILLRTDRSEEALEVSTRLVRARPDYEGGWIVQGRAYMQLGQPAEATESFQRAWQIDPYNPVTARRLAKAAAQLGNQDGANMWSQKALSLESRR